MVFQELYESPEIRYEIVLVHLYALGATRPIAIIGFSMGSITKELL